MAHARCDRVRCHHDAPVSLLPHHNGGRRSRSTVSDMGGTTIRRRALLLVVALSTLLLLPACRASDATPPLREPAETLTPTPQTAGSTPTPTLGEPTATPPPTPQTARSTPTPTLVQPAATPPPTPQTAGSTPTPTPVQPAATPPQSVLQGEGTTPDGPDFHMVAYQGQAVLGADELAVTQLFGRGKPVVLNFWAGLCPPCRAEMPGFQRVYDDLGDQFLLVGVDIGPFVGLGSHADARALLDELNISYPPAYATEDPTRSFAVLGMPTTVLFTADGRTVAKHTGFLPEDALRSALKDLLAPSL